MDSEVDIWELAKWVDFNYVSLEVCDLCGDYFPILNLNDGDRYIKFTGKQFL